MELLFKDTVPLLFRGNRYVYPGEVVEVSKEEADHRLKIQPGMWESKAPAKKDEPVKKAVEKKVGEKVIKK